MKVAVVNVPWEHDGKTGIRAGCRFPNLMPKKHNSYVPFPFLIAYTGSYLESKGYRVMVIDGIAERCSEENFLSRLRRFAPDLVIAETATTSFHNDVGILGRFKADGTTAKIAIYGPHVSAIPRGALEYPGIDFTMQGEPEITSSELCSSLDQGCRSFSDIAGLVYRDASGEICVNRRRPQIEDIETLPYPMREGLPMENYNVPGFPPRVMFIYASRGCPFQCTFCLWPQTIFERGTYRPRAAAKIVEEMAYLIRRYPATSSFFFDDDTFNLGRARMLEFANEMKRHNLRIPWGMNARADHLDRELLLRLMDTGLFTLRIGIESGDQTVLDGAKKGLNLKRVREALQLTHSLGIQNHVSFMVGLEGETHQSIEATARYIKTIPVESVQFSVAVPFPGTELHQIVEGKGFLVEQDWERYNGSENAVMRTESMTADEIKDAIVQLRRRVYFSPRFVRRRLRYVRNLNDVAALSRKALRLVLHRKSSSRPRGTEA